MKDILIQDILHEPVSLVASKWIIEGIPFIFSDDYQSYVMWKERLSELIGVDSKSIVLTGSSSVGYSLNPKKNFSAFQSNSDIDIAIVSSHYFNIAWHFILNLGTKYYRLKPKEQIAINDHRQRLIFYGTIATDKIVHLLPFGQEWTEAMNEMKTIDPTKDRVINFRIYKDFEALKSYQIIGVKKLKDKLLES